MIRNNWRGLIDKAGIKQNDIAKRAGVSAGLLSQTVNGQSVLEYDVLVTVCEIIGCKPENVYDEAIMESVYHKTKKEKAVRSTVSVRIPRERADEVDAKLVETGVYESRNEAVNAAICSFLKLSSSKKPVGFVSSKAH